MTSPNESARISQTSQSATWTMDFSGLSIAITLRVIIGPTSSGRGSSLRRGTASGSKARPTDRPHR